MEGWYIILEDFINQSHVLNEASEKYKGQITGLLASKNPFNPPEVVDVIEIFGYAIITVNAEGGIETVSILEK